MRGCDFLGASYRLSLPAKKAQTPSESDAMSSCSLGLRCQQSRRDCTTAFLPEADWDLEHRPGADTSSATLNRQTPRQILHTSVGGGRARLRRSVDFLRACERFYERQLNRKPDDQKAALPEADAPQSQESKIDRFIFIDLLVTGGSKLQFRFEALARQTLCISAPSTTTV